MWYQHQKPVAICDHMHCLFYCHAAIAVLDVLNADSECRVLPADVVVAFAMEHAC